MALWPCYSLVTESPDFKWMLSYLKQMWDWFSKSKLQI